MVELAYMTGLVMSTATHPATMAIAILAVLGLKRWWAIPIAGVVTGVVIEFAFRRPNLDRMGLEQSANPMPQMTDFLAGCLAATLVLILVVTLRKVTG